MTIRYVYHQLSPSEKNEIISLWTLSGVLRLEEARKRVEEVSVVLLDNDKIVGVSTVYRGLLKEPNREYFFVRMFIKKESRGSNQTRTGMMQCNFKELKHHFPDVSGLIVELENQKLARLAYKTDYLKERGYRYFGLSARGLQLWCADFSSPQGIFIETV